jgi:hypothetical protein
MELRPWRGRGWPEVGDGADGWAPSVRERRREEGEVGWRWWAARRFRGPRGRKRAGLRKGLDRFVFFFFFLFFFKPIFKPISNLFKFKSFTSFQIQILTQISPTILKAFHKPFLTTFQTYLKFKHLHNFSQFFSQLF